jgi:hypothetical protein
MNSEVKKRVDRILFVKTATILDAFELDRRLLPESPVSLPIVAF